MKIKLFIQTKQCESIIKNLSNSYVVDSDRNVKRNRKRRRVECKYTDCCWERGWEWEEAANWMSESSSLETSWKAKRP
jgi:Rad3-related DNA helicase